ncbi:SDR family NAD(P)-dependent oxidoreductase [Natronospora cellulosivora (SeqCode)]
MSKYYYPEERIAIVGMGGLFPDASNIQAFWDNILNKKVSIKDVPEEVLNREVFYNPNVFKKIRKNDKTYTQIGATIDYDNYTALCHKYKIPPAVAEHMDPNQHVNIYCVDQALESLKNSELPKERTAVILGTGAPGARYDNIIRRNYYAKVKHYLKNNPKFSKNFSESERDELLAELSEKALMDTIPITEDSAPGMLQNISAARITNIFDFYGPSYTVDAACASGLAASVCGITGLLRKDFDAVFVGASEVTFSATPLVVFSAINALSPDGSFPFDSRANGFVMGLGGGVLLLKRLEDALRDKDYIYGLISGFGQGSDGKGKYIAAPKEEGQINVVENACKMAGYPVDTIELIEAHGTGTIVGDAVEISALKTAFTNLGVSKKNYCGIGSVKSNIGHLRYASGAPGLIKASLALHNKVLPPTANIKEVNPKLKIEDSPFYILEDKKKWEENSSHPRRVNVSSYGFGGADYHIAMEEYRPEFLKKQYSFSSKKTVFSTQSSKHLDSVINNTREVVFLSGNSLEELKVNYTEFLNQYEENLNFLETAFLNNSAISVDNEIRLAIVASSIDDVKEKWEYFNKISNEEDFNTKGLNLKGIFYGRGDKVNSENLALMFPGQASQYPNMLKSIYDNYPCIQSLYMQVDALWKAKYKKDVTSLIFGDNEETLDEELKNTINTHPAIFLSNMAMYKLLKESGVKADYILGHSLGEVTALYAAEMLDLSSAIEIIGERGLSFDSIEEEARGLLMVVKGDSEELEEIIAEKSLDLSVANINSAEQTVIGGEVKELDSLEEHLKENQIKYKILNVSHAFHTELMSEAADKFYAKIKDIEFSKANAKVMACHLQEFYPSTEKGLKEIPSMLRDHILATVNFKAAVEKLYKKGVRVFIETGPSSVLSNLLNNILEGKDVKVLSVNKKRKDAIEAYKEVLGELFVLGYKINPLPSKFALETATQGDNFIKDYNLSEQNIQNQQVNTIADNIDSKESIDKQNTIEKASIVYSGVSVGLPGTFKDAFSDDNFEYLFEGKNMIEMLRDDEKESLLDLNITRLIKKEGNSIFKKLSSINEVIQIAGKLGKLDMEEDYHIDEKILKQMSSDVCAGVAAGYEALKDAGIPLIREKIKTSSGSYLPGRLVLPKEMQDDTGVIFASGFSTFEPLISEVSKYLSSKFAYKNRNDLIDFYESVISRVSDSNARKLLSDWFNFHYNKLINNLGEDEIYQFNHDFLTQVNSQANSRMAQLIGAEGPNFFIQSACSSTASALTIAEDLIRAGHASRMIVLGADAVSEKTLPWIGASFLSVGAATDSKNVFESAVPFDKRRNGMILGSGSVGLLIEKEKDVKKRGMTGICRILGTHAFNTAGHQSKIDTNKYCLEMDKFISKMEKEYNLDRREIAKNTVYFSHETYTPRKGGCSETEKQALERTFADSYRDLKVVNTKGMTGHTLGASIEEAVAAKSLQYQKIPPVVNYKEADSALEGLNISRGGKYNFDYALRTVIGFGGHGGYHLLEKLAKGDDRIYDQRLYNDWISSLSDSSNTDLKIMGRVLIAEGDLNVEQTLENINIKDKISTRDLENEGDNNKSLDEIKENQKNHNNQDHDYNEMIKKEVLDVYSEVSKYPIDMLDLDMEAEADLGIDTVKQATIFSMISEKLKIPQEEDIQLSNYPTIGHIVRLAQEKSGLREKTKNENNNFKEKNTTIIDAKSDYSDEIFDLVSNVTKYPVEMLEKDMEMEADLGIDTVKQATIFSLIAEKYGFEEDQELNISEYKTISSLINFVQEKKGIKESTNHAEEVLKVISEITKYPVDMLEYEMEMEADLGIDTVKQATIFSILGEKFGLEQNEDMNISEYRTIAAVIDFFEKDSLEKDNLKKDASSNNSISNELQLEDLENLNDEVAVSLSTEKIEENNIKENFKEEDIQDSDNIMIERNLSLQVPVYVEEKIGKKEYELKNKSICVIGDVEETVKNIANYFRKESESVEEFLFVDYEDKAELEVAVGKILEKDYDIILDCSHIGEEVDLEKISKKQEKELIYLNSEARFIFYKKLNLRNPKPSLRILALTSMDGSHGFSKDDDKKKDPFYGALAGFYKGLRKEISNSKIKIIDLDIESNKINKAVFNKLLREIEGPFSAFEIAYQDNKRHVLKIDYFDIQELEDLKLPDNPHFLLAGGGYGIGAEIVRALSDIYNAKFTIIGRTEIPEHIGLLSKLSEEQLSEKKIEIKKRLEKANEKVTPLMVQREYKKLEKSISVYNLINEIKSKNNEVLYLSCDIQDYDKLSKVLELAVDNNGSIDVLIQTAGIEKSRLMKEKSNEEFNKIFNVKVQGTLNLFRLLDKKELKAFMAFSSISGRFGNEAQVDYCSANNFISSFINVFKAKYKDIHALSIAWSGWKNVGMAWRNEFVRKHSEEMGLHLIEVERGAAEFIRFLRGKTNVGEVIISKGLNNFLAKDLLKNKYSNAPWIDWVSKKDGKIQKAFKVFSVKRDPIIDHHRLGKTPLMPAVGFMELAAQCHSLYFGQKEQYCFRNIKLFNPLKLYHEKPQEVVVLANSEIEGESIKLDVYNDFQSKYGISKFIPLNTMIVSNQLSNYKELLNLKKIENDSMEKGYSKIDLDNYHQKNQNSIVLGTLFMDDEKENNVYRRDKNGAVYSMTLPIEELENEKYQLDKLLVNPAFMDSVFQTCGVHTLVNDNRVYLPWEIEEFGVVKKPIELCRYIAYSKVIKEEEDCKVYDVILLNDKDEVCYYAKNVTMRRINL